MLLLLMLAGVPRLVAGAQPNKTKAQKAPPVAEDPGPWLLAGREGECAPLLLLAKKGPEYGDVQSPSQLAEKIARRRA